MNRLDKTIEIISELKELVEQIDTWLTWLVLTEGWCGDSAQIVPVFNKMHKLIAVDENFEKFFNWGSRPKVLQEMFYHMRANAINNDTIQDERHQWYAYDKTITTQKELLKLLKETYCNWMQRKVAYKASC